MQVHLHFTALESCLVFTPKGSAQKGLPFSRPQAWSVNSHRPLECLLTILPCSSLSCSQLSAQNFSSARNLSSTPGAGNNFLAKFHTVKSQKTLARPTILWLRLFHRITSSAVCAQSVKLQSQMEDHSEEQHELRVSVLHTARSTGTGSEEWEAPRLYGRFGVRGRCRRYVTFRFPVKAAVRLVPEREQNNIRAQIQDFGLEVRW